VCRNNGISLIVGVFVLCCLSAFLFLRFVRSFVPAKADDGRTGNGVCRDT